MTNAILKTKYVVVFFLMALSFSCSPEDGNDGVDGPQGPAGQDGNANVTSVLFKNQTLSIGANTFAMTELTQDIFDNGVVYAYITVDGNQFWETIPLIIGGDTKLDIDRIEVGVATLMSTFDQGNLNLRFILVAGTSANKTTNKKGAVDISKMSYQEAMNYFGLDY